MRAETRSLFPPELGFLEKWKEIIISKSQKKAERDTSLQTAEGALGVKKRRCVAERK